MSGGRRPLGPTIALVLTLVALVIAGVWVWHAASSGASGTRIVEPDREQPSRDASAAEGERFNAAERGALEDALRRKRPPRSEAETTP